MTGDEAEAQRRFRECVDSPLDRPHVKASAMAHLAVIEIEHGRWEPATELAREAKRVLGPSPSDAHPASWCSRSTCIETRTDPTGVGYDDRALCGQSLMDLLGWRPG